MVQIGGNFLNTPVVLYPNLSTKVMINDSAHATDSIEVLHIHDITDRAFAEDFISVARDTP